MPGVLIEDHAAEQIGEFRGGTHAFHPPVFIKCIVSHQIWKTQQEMRIFRLICRSRRHRRGPGHRGRPRRIPQDRLGIRKSRSIQFRPEWCCPKISRSSRLTLVKGGRRPPFLRSVSKSKYVRPAGPGPAEEGQQLLLGTGLLKNRWSRTWAEAPPG